MFSKSTEKRSEYRIVRVPRRPLINSAKVSPMKNIKYDEAQLNDNFQIDSIPQSSFHNEISTQLSVIDTDKTEQLSTSTSSIKLLSPIENLNIKKPMKSTNSGLIHCFNRLTPKQQLLIKIVLIIILLIIIATIATLPPVLILVLHKSTLSSSTNTTVSVCSSQTCIGKETTFRGSGTTVLYPFDGTANDLTGYANGAVFGISIPTTYLSQGYVRQTLYLNANLSQYILIPSINLAQQSFTLQVWIFPLSTNSQINYGIFSLCDSNLICLSLSLLNYHVALSFDSMNINNQILIGTSVLEPSVWYHITIVYDGILFQQLIYVNGRIDAVSNSIIYPYQNKSSTLTTTIGRSLSYNYNTSYFHGWVDQFTILTGIIRTYCEAYNDATLTAYFPFDTNGTYLDYSMNYFHGAGLDIQMITSGRRNQAIAFQLSTSYFQSQCFPSTRVGNPPFSVSIWIKPYRITGGGTIVHISNIQAGNGTICYDLLGLTNSGILVGQFMQTSSIVNGIQGPILSNNTWTHVVVIYAPANGLRLFINGQLYATTFMTSFSIPTVGYWDALYITLGNNSPYNSTFAASCPFSSLNPVSGSYYGAIDEFRLYNRELDAQEICVLANV